MESTPKRHWHQSRNCEIVIGNTHLGIVNVYIPPPPIITGSFATLLQTLENNCSIIEGNFNVFHPLWWSEVGQ